MRKTIICLSMNLLAISTFAQTPVLEETFDDNRNGWLDKPYRDTSINGSIAGGVLQISNNNKDSNWPYTIHQKLDERKDFEIQLKFEIKQGPGKRQSYGSIYWGGNDSTANSWILFSRKRIKAKNCRGENHQKDQLFIKENQRILKDGTSNKPSIRKSNNVYRVYLNDIFRLEFPFQKFIGDNLSLAVGKNCTIVFYDLKIFYN